MMRSRWDRGIELGFLAAGAYNVLGMLSVSHGFTNEHLARVDPDVFSWLGQIAVILWGLAYWSVTRTHRSVPALIAVFAIEKLVYGVVWLRWMSLHAAELPRIAAESAQTASFYGSYGAGDLVFFVFFACVALRTVLAQREGSAKNPRTSD